MTWLGVLWPLVLVAVAVVWILSSRSSHDLGGRRVHGVGSRLGSALGGFAVTGRALGAPTGAPAGARWATRTDLRPLLAPRSPGRMQLGLATCGGSIAGLWGSRSGNLLTTEPSQSVAIIGPTQSGKTSCLAVPAILGWEGPVLAASVKTDLLRDTEAVRRQSGSVWCFDPAEVTSLPHTMWSPLRVARTWNGARRVAADMTEVGRSGGTTADGEFWYSMAAKLLAPLLFAAAFGRRTMADVIRWVDTQEVGEVVELLEEAGVQDALQAAQSNWLREERQRSSVYTTAESILEPFVDGSRNCGVDRELLGEEPALGWEDPFEPGAMEPIGAIDSMEAVEAIDPEALLDGHNTLYVCAPAHDQKRLVGLFTAVVKDVVQTAFTRAARRANALDPPLLIVLDEAANIAPLAELDGLASTCAGHGVQLVTVWQDLAQISARYGARAATVINNHRAKIFLAGISDPSTLDHASQLIGEEQRMVPSITRDPTGGRATTMSYAPRPLLPGDALRQMSPGSGVLLYGSLPPVRLRLRPWWQDRELGGAGTPPGRP